MHGTWACGACKSVGIVHGEYDEIANMRCPKCASLDCVVEWGPEEGKTLILAAHFDGTKVTLHTPWANEAPERRLLREAFMAWDDKRWESGESRRVPTKEEWLQHCGNFYDWIMSLRG